MNKENSIDADKGNFMRIVCCDDENEIGCQIETYLKEYFGKIRLNWPDFKYFNDGKELLAYNKAVDIIFLDVKVSGLSGIYIGEELKKRNPDIIIFIVTSHLEYLDEAMRFQVFRYLSKPVDKERLFRNMKDALAQYNSTSRKVLIETRAETKIVCKKDIIYIEARERKVWVYTEAQVYESVHTMQFWLEHLKEGCFFQTHRSYIVNLGFVSSFDHAFVYLVNEKYKAYLTQRKYKQFKDAYFLYLESME